MEWLGVRGRGRSAHNLRRFIELLLVGYDLGEASTTRTYAIVTGLTLLGTVLLLVGLIGLYVGQLENAGLLGLVGFLVTFVGNVLVAGAVWEATFVVPWLAGEAPELLDEVPTGLLALGFISSYTLAGLGLILFGVATIRARVFPTAAAVLLIIGVVPVAVWNVVPLPLPDVLLGVAVAWLGLALFRGGGEGARQAPLSGEDSLQARVPRGHLRAPSGCPKGDGLAPRAANPRRGRPAVVEWRGHATSIVDRPYDNNYFWVICVAEDRTVEMRAHLDVALVEELFRTTQR